MKGSLKRVYKTILTLFYYSGITYLSNKINDAKIRILMYHRVNYNDDGFLPWDFDLYVTPKNFEAQVKYLKSKYNLISLDQACQYIKNGQIPKKSVVLTFDDGFMDNYEFAYPILAKYEVPATFFIISDTLLKKEPVWLHKYYFMKKKRVNSKLFNIPLFDLKYKIEHNEAKELINKEWKEHNFDNFINKVYMTFKEIKKAKGVSFGSHTKSHVAVSKLKDNNQLKEEITMSKKIIEKSVSCNHFAYPFGDRNSFNQGSIKLVSENYMSGLTTLEGFVKKGDNLFTLKRLSVVAEDLQDFKNVLGGTRAFLIKCHNFING